MRTNQRRQNGSSMQAHRNKRYQTDRPQKQPRNVRVIPQKWNHRGRNISDAARKPQATKRPVDLREKISGIQQRPRNGHRVPQGQRPNARLQAESNNQNRQKQDKCRANQALRQELREGSCTLEPTYVTVPLFVFCKKIAVALDTGVGLTKIGKDIANMAVANGFAQRSKTFTYDGKSRRAGVINILCGARLNRLKSIECLIDSAVPPMGVIMGLQAMRVLNYSIVVDQEAATHHGATRVTEEVVQQEAGTFETWNEPEIEEEIVIHLTGSELREIENL